MSTYWNLRFFYLLRLFGFFQQKVWLCQRIYYSSVPSNHYIECQSLVLIDKMIWSIQNIHLHQLKNNVSAIGTAISVILPRLQCGEHHSPSSWKVISPDLKAFIFNMRTNGKKSIVAELYNCCKIHLPRVLGSWLAWSVMLVSSSHGMLLSVRLVPRGIN